MSTAKQHTPKIMRDGTEWYYEPSVEGGAQKNPVEGVKIYTDNGYHIATVIDTEGSVDWIGRMIDRYNAVPELVEAARHFVQCETVDKDRCSYCGWTKKSGNPFHDCPLTAFRAALKLAGVK